jgi:patatin-like phospholipase/acyl hydrolase
LKLILETAIKDIFRYCSNKNILLHQEYDDILSITEYNLPFEFQSIKFDDSSLLFCVFDICDDLSLNNLNKNFFMTQITTFNDHQKQNTLLIGNKIDYVINECLLS